MKRYPQAIYALTKELIKCYYKFIPRLQPSLLRSKYKNLGQVPKNFQFPQKVLKEEDIQSERYSHLYIMGKVL